MSKFLNLGIPIVDGALNLFGLAPLCLVTHVMRKIRKKEKIPTTIDNSKEPEDEEKHHDNINKSVLGYIVIISLMGMYYLSMAKGIPVPEGAVTAGAVILGYYFGRMEHVSP